MTQEALRMALDFIEDVNFGEWRGSTERQENVITAIKEALAQEKALQALHSENERLGLYKDAYAQPEQEPVKIAHRHEWFRTGEMKVGQMRCISCGTWGHEEMPQRTWVGLTDEEVRKICVNEWGGYEQCRAIEAKLKERNDISI